MKPLYESILSSTGAGKTNIYANWIERHANGKIEKAGDKFNIYNSEDTSIKTEENFPQGIKIGYCNSVEVKNLTSLQGFPERCRYVTIDGCKLKDFAGCTKEDIDYLEVKNCDIQSLHGFPEQVTRISIGGNKQHFTANEIKKYCKFSAVTTLGTYGMSQVTFNEYDKQYIEEQAEELEKLYMRDIKDLLRLEIRIDKKNHVYILLVFEDNVGFGNWPDGKAAKNNPDYYNNNIYMSFVYLPETRDLARFKQGALDTPDDWDVSQPLIPNTVKTQCKILDMPYRANGGKDFNAVKIDFVAKDIYRKTKKYVKEVIDAAKEDCGGTLHRTTKTIFKY